MKPLSILFRMNDLPGHVKGIQSAIEFLREEGFPHEGLDLIENELVDLHKTVNLLFEERLVVMQKVMSLNHQLERLQSWNEESARYELVETAGGGFVFAPKQEHVDSGETLHYLCPNCFYARRKSILQPFQRSQIKCSRCKEQFRFSNNSSTGK